jgi:hypothetical protein
VIIRIEDVHVTQNLIYNQDFTFCSSKYYFSPKTAPLCLKSWSTHQARYFLTQNRSPMPQQLVYPSLFESLHVIFKLQWQQQIDIFEESEPSGRNLTKYLKSHANKRYDPQFTLKSPITEYRNIHSCYTYCTIPNS